MVKGFKGFTLEHESENFKEKTYFHKNPLETEYWVKELKEEAECRDFNQVYQRLNEIGKGKFSTVYNVRNRETSELLAMKLIDKNKLSVREKEFLREEIQIVRMIDHPNVVIMKEIFETKDFMYIVMELVQGGELFDHIKMKEVGEKEAAFIIYQILEAL